MALSRAEYALPKHIEQLQLPQRALRITEKRKSRLEGRDFFMRLGERVYSSFSSSSASSESMMSSMVLSMAASSLESVLAFFFMNRSICFLWIS